MHVIARATALAALVALAGCVGAPAGGPYAAGYPPAPGYAPQPYGQAPGYAPQPGYVADQQAALGGTCYAGVYTCPLPSALPLGAQCSCPGLGAPSYGTVR